MPCYVEYHQKTGTGLGLLHLVATTIKTERFNTVEEADEFIKDLREDPDVDFIELWCAHPNGWRMLNQIDLS